MDDLRALVTGVLADLDGAGALADWLAEHDREREAVLLRRRWKWWKRERQNALAPEDTAWIEAAIKPLNDLVDALRLLSPTAIVNFDARVELRAAGLENADESFRRYVQRRFLAPSAAPSESS
jgi:hypothetical protein